MLHVVVMAGGSGTRFWPLSRRSRPKQLLSLGADEPLIAATFHRSRELAPPTRWWMLVGADYAEVCRAAVPEVPAAQVLVEPQGRNTAPAIGLAAVHVLRQDPAAVLVILPADHHVGDPAALTLALQAAAALAERGPIVTLGISPTRPETGYGYIQRGAPDRRQPGSFVVQRFCEKPDLERAEEFLRQGGFDWNAGIFVARADVILDEIGRQLPILRDGLEAIGKSLGTPGEASTLSAVFPKLPSVSFDYGVMEAAREVAVVPVSCGWSDVGSFGALDSLLGRDERGNLIGGRAVAIDSDACVLYAEPGQLVAAVGVSGLAVIHSKDATLVVPVERAQEVRAVLERLRAKGWTEYL